VRARQFGENDPGAGKCLSVLIQKNIVDLFHSNTISMQTI
jgi:hypothetical protein